MNRIMVTTSPLTFAGDPWQGTLRAYVRLFHPATPSDAVRALRAAWRTRKPIHRRTVAAAVIFGDLVTVHRFHV